MRSRHHGEVPSVVRNTAYSMDEALG
jgi:hypothetical protein